MASSVALHQLAHVLIELLTVFCQLHIDEIDDDNAAHVSQAKLTRQLLCRSEIDLEGIGLLAVLVASAVTAVDVNDVQGLRMLDDEVGSVLVGNSLAEA